MTSAEHRSALVAVLVEAQEQGLLGPAPVAQQLAHAEAFAAAAGRVPHRALDLGSGGGLPGLVLAVLAWVDATLLLVDARQRRAAFLAAAVARLGLAERVTVRHGRAELLGRDAALRGTFDVVVARSFGPPAVAAECAAPFLSPGGCLVVSEPPRAVAGRWPTAGLTSLGLAPPCLVPGPPAFAVLAQQTPCPEQFPRRAGVPERRPLWVVAPANGSS